MSIVSTGAIVAVTANTILSNTVGSSHAVIQRPRAVTCDPWYACYRSLRPSVAWSSSASSLRGSGDGMARPEKSRKSLVVKRSIMIDRHKTSISLEDDFWNALQEISAAKSVRPSELVAIIDHPREHTNLSSAIRLYVLDYYRSLADRKATSEEAKRNPRQK